jgi:peptidoglycan/LPS O-acetylase OafA/YrhL
VTSVEARQPGPSSAGPSGAGPSGAESAGGSGGGRSERFRPDIQALRAIAVGAVVLYHWWPERVRGGYVGVDVFFVISGFLITRHLADELLDRGTVSLTRFWARRIRRLLPAAFLVLLVSLLTLLLLMPSATWRVNLREIAAATLYGENWLLARNAVDYLAAHNSASLVQHYWSLSVEEQFYLGWPLLLLAAAALGRRLRGAAGLRSLRVALVAVAAGSFALSVVHTALSPATAFFATWTRAWEFAAGGLVALSPLAGAGDRPVAAGTAGRAAWRAAAGWAGLAVIAGSTLLITADAAFPGWIAAVPVLGAVLVLGAGHSPARWSSARLVALRPLQWLGDQSYALYLWHWPVIIAAPWVLHRAPSWPEQLLLLALTLPAARLTKRLVEDPFRTSPRLRRSPRPAYAFAVAGMAVLVAGSLLADQQLGRTVQARAATALARVQAGERCFGGAAIVDRSCRQPFARPADLDTAFAAADYDLRGDDCQQNAGATRVAFCSYGQTRRPTTTVVVVGNSHAVRLVPALDLYGRAHGWRVLLAAHTDCLGLTTRPVGGLHPGSACLAWSAQLQQQLLRMPGLGAVVFASHRDAATYLAGDGAGPAALAAAGDDVLRTWTALHARGIPVLVAEDVPGMRPRSGPECVALEAGDDPCALPRAQVVRPNLVSDLAQRHPELVGYLPMTRYFCDPARCHSLIGGVVVYTDSHHLTTTYSRSLARYLGPQLAQLLRRP